MQTPFFSLVVPTVNRTTELVTLFASLRKQTFHDFEVILVDQNEDSRLASIVQEYSDLSIIHIFQSKRGASAARNAGLKLAKGDVITFPDDDCEYPDDLLERVKGVFQTNKEIDGITCSSRDKNFQGKIARMSTKYGRINKLNVLPKTIEFTIFVRSILVQNFYFDEDLGVGAETPWWSDEGPDLVLRLIYKGALFVYFPSIIIFHPNPVKIFDEKACLRAYRYGLGRGRFLNKHNYPILYVVYVWGLYLVGIALGCLQFNLGKIKYYYSGLKGRIEGYKHN